MINTVIFCGLSFVITGLGFWIFIRNFPEKRSQSMLVRVTFWVIFGGLNFLQAWDAQHAFISYLQIITYGFINACVLSLFYVGEFKIALLWEYFYNITFSILKMPVLTIRGVLESKNLLLINVKYGRVLLENIWCLAIVLIIGVSCVKWKKQLSGIMKRILQKERYVLLVFEIIEYTLLTVMLELGKQMFLIRDFIINTFAIFSITCSCIIAGIYFLYLDSKKEQINLTIQREGLLEEQKLSKDYYEKHAKRLHEMKHILLYLEKCIDNSEYDKAQVCLDKYLKDVKGYQKMVWTGISEIDFIINSKYQKIEQKDIHFLLQIEMHEIPINEDEFMVVLGNLLDNAVEATEKCDKGKRDITLKMKNVNDMYMMNIENTCLSKPKEKDGHLVTTKKGDDIWHGWGIQNVEQIVEKYGGDFKFEYGNGHFVVNIMFYGRSTK